MDIGKRLREGHNKAVTNAIVKYIGNDAGRFQQLLVCFLGEDNRISQRSSWALGDVSQLHPKLFNPHHRTLIDCLKDKHHHNAIKRNIVRTYQVADIPAEYEAELYDLCFNFIADVDEPIAVKAFSIRVCERIIEKYPEMANELLILIKENISNWSSGLKNRGTKFIKRWGS